MKVPDLDILAGLEEAFFKVVQFASATSQNRIILRRSSPARSRYREVARRSLFVKWNGIYNDLTIGQHEAWTAYWITLPFGDHGGQNGWPGSGFSAFVYVNAPRYQAGLDLLLNPPAANLLTNGNFNGNTTGWFLSGVFEYDDHDVKILAGDYGDGSTLFQNLTGLVDGASYHISFRIKYATTGADGEPIPYVNIGASLGSDGSFSDYSWILQETDGDWHTAEGDLIAHTQVGEDNPFRFYPGYLGVEFDTYVYVTDFILTPNF